METVEKWTPEEARKHRDTAWECFRESWHERDRSHHVYGPAMYRQSERVTMERQSCGLCALRGYDYVGSEHNVDRDGPNYAGWARLYVEAGIPIPTRWEDAFRRERERTDAPGYVLALEKSIATFGVVFA